MILSESERGCTLERWLADAAGTEPIEAVVIGSPVDCDAAEEGVAGTVLSWDEARPHLREAFDDGYGSQGCRAVYAWTETRVMFISVYDGATSLDSVPRHPTNVRPGMVGRQ